MSLAVRLGLTPRNKCPQQPLAWLCHCTPVPGSSWVLRRMQHRVGAQGPRPTEPSGQGQPLLWPQWPCLSSEADSCGLAGLSRGGDGKAEEVITALAAPPPSLLPVASFPPTGGPRASGGGSRGWGAQPRADSGPELGPGPRTFVIISPTPGRAPRARDEPGKVSASSHPQLWGEERGAGGGGGGAAGGGFWGGAAWRRGHTVPGGPGKGTQAGATTCTKAWKPLGLPGGQVGRLEGG